jgi:hypothetical protein
MRKPRDEARRATSRLLAPARGSERFDGERFSFLDENSAGKLAAMRIERSHGGVVPTTGKR